MPESEGGADAKGVLSSLVETEVLQNAIATPDVTYLTDSRNVTTVPSSQLRVHNPQPVTHGTLGFYRWLLWQQQWRIRTLMNLYELIGYHQQAFLFSLEPSKLRPLPITQVGSTVGLPYSDSTYYRLIRSRTVMVQASDREKILRVPVLLITAGAIKRYFDARSLNAILRAEFDSGKALSDAKLADRTGLNRRTIAKYRCEASVPAHGDRTEKYQGNSPRLFQIHTGLEAYFDT